MDENQILLLKEFELVDFPADDEAFASVSVGAPVSWVKFILTDDQPNANKQRIPGEEFANLIKSGVYMPVKMAAGQIADGHENSIPIGVITNLKQLKNQIVGLAALWERERPDDVSLIKTRFAQKLPLQLSWEILFSESTRSEDGVEELRGTALRAATLVNRPAFEGRTPIIAVAAIEEPTTNSNVEDETLEDKNLTTQVEELQASLTEKETAMAGMTQEIESLKAQLSDLQAYKDNIEKARLEEEKLASIKAKFAAANLTKDEQYFVSNKEMLLNLAPEALDFMIQEVVAFSVAAESSASVHSTVPEIPNFKSKGKSEPTTEDLVNFLRKTVK